MNRFARLALLAAFILSSCGGKKAQPDSIEPSVGYAATVLGRSVEQRPIIVERFGREGPVAFLFHTIHGNEQPAQQCAERMRTWLLSHPEAYQDLQVAFVGLVNPDGYRAVTRRNANGIDLNRNFPATNFEPSDTYGPSPASEPETRVIVDVMEYADPAVIVTVHSPLAVINYDGPAAELAEHASEVTGIPVDVDLGPYPGSFGSYAGLDLQIPTITLETADPLFSRSQHLVWNQVEELALEWVLAQAMPNGPDLTGLVVDRDASDEYQVFGLGDSAGGRPLVAERFGHQGDPVLVVAGLDGSDMAALCAERFRARLQGLLSQDGEQRRVLLISLANPDGLASGQALDEAGLDPDQSFETGFTPGDEAGSEPFQCVEAAAIRDAIGDHDVAALVVLQGGLDQLQISTDGDAEGMRAAAAQALYTTPESLEAGRPGSLAAWAAAQDIPALTIDVPAQPENVDLLRADNLGEVLEAVVAAAPR